MRRTVYFAVVQDDDDNDDDKQTNKRERKEKRKGVTKKQSVKLFLKCKRSHGVKRLIHQN